MSGMEGDGEFGKVARDKSRADGKCQAPIQPYRSIIQHLRL